MATDDVRISAWDLRASAGTTVSLEFTSSEALTSLAVYTGGTTADVDDLTGATAHTATLSGGNLVATVEVDVPTGSSVPLRLVVDGAVQSVGRLIPSTSGTASPDNTITLTPGSFAFDLTVLGIVVNEGEVGSGATLEQVQDDLGNTSLIAGTSLTKVYNDAAGTITLNVDAGDFDAAGTAAGLVAPLDGRLDTIEADYLQQADIASMETTAGAQAKADAAQAAAIQRANHTGTQTASTISDFTEAVQDAVAALLGAGSNVTLTYDDASDSLTIAATGGGASYTDEQVRDAIGVALVGAGLISVTPNDALDTITITTTATQNSTDAHLLDRANHTGSQAIATVTGLQAALDAKAPLASPTFTGTPAAPTPTAGDNTTKLATTAFVKTATDALSGTYLAQADAPELIRDTIGTALVAGSNVTITPNDGSDTITIAATGGGGGAVATDSIFDAKGDLVVGSGPDAAVRLPVATSSGQTLVPDVTAAGGIAWANPTDIRDVTLRPPGTIAQTFDRWYTLSNQSVLTSGRLMLVAIPLPRNRVVTSISFVSGSTGAASPTNQWFGIFDDSLAALGFTNDDTTTAWASSTTKTLNLASPVTTAYGGKFFIGIMVAATTVPTLRAVVHSAGVTYTDIAGQSTTGQTTPPALPFTAAALVTASASPYAYVS